MQILHVISRIRLEDGGVVRAVLDLATGAADAGHRVAVATWDAADAPAAWAAHDSNPRIVPIEEPGRLGTLAQASRVTLDAEIRSADAVHLHTPWEPINRVIAKRCLALRTPYAVSIHGMLDDWSMSQSSLKKRVYLRLGGRSMLERAAFVHCTAGAELTQSRVWYPGGTGRVAPLVFDLSPYREPVGPELAREAFGIDPDLPTVLFLSRMHIKKGVHVLVKAAAHLRDAGVECQTLIAGTGDSAYEAGIRAQIASLGLDDRVRLLGMVKGDTKVSLYRAADVFALPTSQENFGFVLPEALACETPAITTRGVDIWPELEASGSTLIVEQSHEAFAEAIAGLLVDEDRRREMGRKGRGWVLSYLEPSAVQAMYDDLYRDATQKG
ncbi:MAG: glycosyltransferase [Planctomycetota bacterium]